MRLLLADDHIMLRDGLKPYLRDLDPEVEIFEAGSYIEMFEVLSREHPIDLALLDLRMPGMDWWSALDKLRRQWPALRVAVLSSVTERNVVLDTLNLGVVGFIPKHLSAGALLSALQLVFAGEKFVPAMLLAASAEPAGRSDPAVTSSDDSLTRRERDVLRLVRDGLPNKAIARELRVSEITVKSHLCHVFRKLGVQNRVQAARVSLRTDEL